MSGADTGGVRLYKPSASRAHFRVAFYDPADGRRVFRHYREETEALEGFSQALEYVIAARAAGGAGRQPLRGRTVEALFASLSGFWVKSGASAGYMRSRDGLYRNWVAPVCGAMPVSDWARHPEACQTVIHNAVTGGGGRPAVAAPTVANIRSVLVSLVLHAQRLGWISDRVNPMAQVRHRRLARSGLYVPASERPTTAMVEALAEAMDILGHSTGRPWLGLQVRIAGYCGLRFGEQTALTPAAVLADGAFLAVTQAWSYNRRSPATLGLPKNRQDRQVPVRGSMRPALAARAAEVEAEAGPAGLLFPGPEQTVPMSDTTFRRLFTRSARNAGWAMAAGGQRTVIPYRNLRHHAATWMRETAGFDWADVSRYLGHHSVAFTTERYIRPGVGADERNATRMEEL